MADVSVGLWVHIRAKEGKQDEVAAFLEQARGMVEQEPDTAAWYAVRMGSSDFGIFDVFASDEGRQAHLNGAVASALMGAVGELVEEPKIEQIDVLASTP